MSGSDPGVSHSSDIAQMSTIEMPIQIRVPTPVELVAGDANGVFRDRHQVLPAASKLCAGEKLLMKLSEINWVLSR